MEQFFLGYFTSSLEPQKDSFPFSQFVIGSLPVREQFCGLHSQGLTWILCFDFKWSIKRSVLEPPAFDSRSTNCALVLVERCFIRNCSKLLIFFDY